jgi:type I restriction enzyme S subunit
MKCKTTTIGDVCFVQTGPFGSQLHNKDYVVDGTPIATVEHLGQRKMRRQNLPCVSNADKDRLSKYTLDFGDLVFSRVGSVDRCSLVSEDEDGWMFSGRCLRVRPKDPLKIYHKYLYYFFCLESTKDYVRNIAVGATMPSLNTRLLSEVPVAFPNIDEQRQIGDTLSSLDDRIEVNARINHHLVAWILRFVIILLQNARDSILSNVLNQVVLLTVSKYLSLLILLLKREMNGIFLVFIHLNLIYRQFARHQFG